MNSLEIFWQNKRITQATRTILAEFLGTRLKGAVTFKDPVFRESDIPFEVQSFVMLRLNGHKESAPIIIGSCQADFQKVFYQAIAPADGSTLEPKGVETELLKQLYRVVEVELKASQINIDPKNVISVVNKSLGQWTSVTVTQSVQFPITTPAGDLVFEIPLFNDEFHQERVRTFFGFESSSRIMVVDDAPTSRKLGMHLLGSVGYQNIEECADGQAALTKILGAKRPFDLIIADWHMPNMTGIELLKKIRATPQVKDLPVLLVTGERNQEEVLNAIRARVSGYIVKPFEPEALYKALKKISTDVAASAAKKAA